MSSESEQTPGSSPPPSDLLVDAIRALIREELKKPAPPPEEEQQPTWQDGFWLLVLVVDVVLLVELVPENWWKDPVLEMPGKLLPWLGGGTFVLGATWFRHRLIAFSRTQSIKVVVACLLAPLVLLHIRFISQRPWINPPNLTLFVDGRMVKGDFHGQTRVWLRLANHTFKIQPDENTGNNGREISWSWSRLLREWLRGRDPHWALIYPVTIVSDGPGCTVRIKEADQNEIDTDFAGEGMKRNSGFLEFEPKATSDPIQLPRGTYKFIVDKAGCQTRELPQYVNIPSDDTVDFGKMICPAR